MHAWFSNCSPLERFVDCGPRRTWGLPCQSLSLPTSEDADRFATRLPSLGFRSPKDPLALIAETAMISLLPLRSKLPQVMVHVKIGMAHAFTSRHWAKHAVRSICARPATELIKQGTEAIKIGGIFSRGTSAQVLIQLGPGLDLVWPLERHPQGRPLVHGAFEQGRGRTDLFLS